MPLRTTLFVLCATVLSAAASNAADKVQFKDGDLTLQGVLYRPAGDGPFPAVVAMHGCSGLWTGSGRMSPRFDDWGKRLSAKGFVVLFPDSFGSRDLGSQCLNSRRTVRASRERVLDANAARRWLQSQPWVNADRVSLLGWSNGATATLWTVRDKGSPQPLGDEFRSAVALYPGCVPLQRAAWSARVPTLILLGGADDWTAPGPCQDMAADAHGRGALTTVITYPDAYHDFDRANFPVRQRKGLAFTANGSGTAHLGTNEAARADAITRVPQWLSQ